MEAEVLQSLGTLLVFVGIAVVVVAAVLMTVRQTGEDKTKAAGVIMIGPIPIVFGSDKTSTQTILKLAVALTALSIAAMIIYHFLLR
ncbi:MAG: DUF131 domain-containing protein [Candidatus Bathyarchaeota archaeon]|nr:DUF131 domain-containing protein [Candidatus Bathyarchaeota archaeon]